MTKQDEQMLEKLKAISEKGNHAEVKRDRDGAWIIYEVKKKKTVFG